LVRRGGGKNPSLLAQIPVKKNDEGSMQEKHSFTVGRGKVKRDPGNATGIIGKPSVTGKKTEPSIISVSVYPINTGQNGHPP